MLKAFREKFRKSIFIQNIAVVAGGNAASKLIAILSAPVITRIYTPEDYGVFSVFIAFTAIAVTLSTLRYAVTIPLAKDKLVANNLVKLSFSITLILSLLILLFILLFSESLVTITNTKKISPYIWVFPVAFFGQGMYEALNNWALRHRKFKTITTTRVSQSLSTSATKIGIGALGYKPLGLFLGYIAQSYTGIVQLMIKLFKAEPAFFKQFRINDVIAAAKRYKQFPLYQSWSQLLLSLGVQLPVILIGMIYGSVTVGVFGLAQNMINLPMNILGQSVAQVYYAEIAKYGKEKPERIYNLTLSVVKKMFLIGIIPFVGLLLGGPWLFQLVFGNEWSEAGIFAQLISPLILLRFISSPVMHCFNVLEKQRAQLVINIIRTLLILLVFYIAWTFKINPRLTIGVYSIGVSLFYLSVILIVIKILNNLRKNAL